jgi:hypothetical protein
MHTTALVTLNMRELDGLKVVQAVVEDGTEAWARGRAAGPDRASGRAMGDALSGHRPGRRMGDAGRCDAARASLADRRPEIAPCCREADWGAVDRTRQQPHTGGASDSRDEKQYASVLESDFSPGSTGPALYDRLRKRLKGARQQDDRGSAARYPWTRNTDTCLVNRLA